MPNRFRDHEKEGLDPIIKYILDDDLFGFRGL